MKFEFFSVIFNKMSVDWSAEAPQNLLNEYSDLCRGCLAQSGEMKNMYEWGLAEDFANFAHIQVIY